MDITDLILFLSRFAQFASAMLIFGALLFRLYFRQEFVGVPVASRAFDRWLQLLLIPAAIVAVASAAVWLDVEAVIMGNGWSDAVNLDTLSTVVLRTGFGQVWTFHLLAAVVLLCVLLSFRGNSQRGAPATLILAVATVLIVTLASVGHSVMRSGSAGRADLTIMVVHVLAGAAWVGSLPPLGYLLHKARGDRQGAWRAAARGILPRYSRAGYFIVGVILLTGCINSWRLVGNIHALVSTTYGRVLILKIGLFVVMVGLALANRFRLVPMVIKRDSTTPENAKPLTLLWRNVALEQLIALLVVAAVSALGTLQPAFTV
jgi:putative copper resistance protein D